MYLLIRWPTFSSVVQHWYPGNHQSQAIWCGWNQTQFGLFVSNTKLKTQPEVSSRTELTKVPSKEQEPETSSNQKFSSKPKTRQHCFDCHVLLSPVFYSEYPLLRYYNTTQPHADFVSLLMYSRAIQQSISQLLPITGKFYAQTVQNIEDQFFI